VNQSSHCNNCFHSEHLPTNRVLQTLYPDSIERRYSSNECVRHCLPANWRKDVSNSAFLDHDSKNEHIEVISVWGIFTQQGELHNWRSKDCLHKNMGGVIGDESTMQKTLTRREEEIVEI